MGKRAISLALGTMLFALCVSAEAQQSAKIPRVGFLSIQVSPAPPLPIRSPMHANGGFMSQESKANIRGGVRGKYYERYREGTNVVLLEPDVTAVFRRNQ